MNNHAANESHPKKVYASPRIKVVGTVADLTLAGLTHPGADTKGGSSLSKGV
jgi:hypothetical protein